MGVLQLINARASDGTILAFGDDLVPVIEALASQAAVALDNQMLLEAQKNLFRAFLQVFANAIDAKSPYTGGHCRRVPELTNMLARAAAEAGQGPFAGFNLSDEEWYELEVAGGLHDCGKVTTREYVVDKATKLETIYNRIHEIRTRFEVVKRDQEIEYLRAVLAGGDEVALEAAARPAPGRARRRFRLRRRMQYRRRVHGAREDRAARAHRPDHLARTLDDALGISWEEGQRRPQGEAKRFLPSRRSSPTSPSISWRMTGRRLAADNPWGFIVKPPAQKFNLGELHNLKVRRGTLTEEERYHINDHIVQTIIMLEALPFPKTLRRVPEWAGGHHEKMDGTGYPRGLKREQMSVPARIMAIADIFEALTARDRPYKTPKKLSECVAIMARMSEDKHIDPELFALFLASGVYRRYAEAFLLPEQIDEVDIARFLPSEAVAAQ